MSPSAEALLAAVKPWREALGWGAAVLVGLWFLWQGVALGAVVPLVIGLVLAGAGGALLVGAVRRRPLVGREPGEGVVQIDEGRIGYFGPRDGGFVSIEGLRRIDMGTEGPAPAWELMAEDGRVLRVPIGARGAEALYDVLDAHLGLDAEAVSAALASRTRARFPIWVRTGDATRRRLH